MSAEQRLRMRRFEVVCQRAIARLNGVAEPSVQDALAARVLELPRRTWRHSATDFVVSFGESFLRVFRFDRVLRVWWWKRARAR